MAVRRRKDMFYLGHRSGLRSGEIAGLRLSDFGFLDEGVIRVRLSYDGPLKENKDGSGKVQCVPAADDCNTFLGPWLTAREASGNGPEDLVFPGPRNKKTPPQDVDQKPLGDRARRARPRSRLVPSHPPQIRLPRP